MLYFSILKQKASPWLGCTSKRNLTLKLQLYPAGRSKYSHMVLEARVLQSHLQQESLRSWETICLMMRPGPLIYTVVCQQLAFHWSEEHRRWLKGPADEYYLGGETQFWDSASTH